MLARVQSVEIGNAVDAEHGGFAVDDELLVSVLQRGLDDPGIALAPVITARVISRTRSPSRARPAGGNRRA